MKTCVMRYRKCATNASFGCIRFMALPKTSLNRLVFLKNQSLSNELANVERELATLRQNHQKSAVVEVSA